VANALPFAVVDARRKVGHDAVADRVIASGAKQSRGKNSMIATLAPGLLRRFFSKSAIAGFA
jgi:hypothetical protein